MDSDGKGLPKQACRSNPTSYLKCDTFDSAMPNGQGMFAFCLPGILTGDVMEVCFGGVGSQYPIPNIIYHKYPVSLGYFVQISRNCFWTNIPYSNINVKCPKIDSIPASLFS